MKIAGTVSAIGKAIPMGMNTSKVGNSMVAKMIDANIGMATSEIYNVVGKGKDVKPPQYYILQSMNASVKGLTAYVGSQYVNEYLAWGGSEYVSKKLKDAINSGDW